MEQNVLSYGPQNQNTLRHNKRKLEQLFKHNCVQWIDYKSPPRWFPQHKCTCSYHAEDARFWYEFAVYKYATHTLQKVINEIECGAIDEGVEWGEWHEPETWEEGYCSNDLPPEDNDTLI